MFVYFLQDEIQTDFQLNVLDYSGKLIAERQLRNINGNYKEQLNWSDLPHGFYLLRLSSKQGITTQKLILK